MPPVTVEQVLRQTGFSDQEIQQLDQRALGAFTGVLTSAQAAQEAAELAQRSNREFYDQTISPALNSWDLEKNEIANARARAEAEAAYYRAQAQAAKENGLIPGDAPGFQPRDSQMGQYISNAPGGIPGSPTLVDDVRAALGDSLWAMQEHQRVTGQMLPDDIMTLAREAQRQKQPFREHVERKYDFAGKRAEMQRRSQEERDSKIRREAEDKVKREYAEKYSSNGDVRMARASAMAEVGRGVKQGTRKDPTMMNDNERREATRRSIHEKISQMAEEG